MMPRAWWHRRVFIAAGIYNIAWAVFSSLDPQWLFRFARMPLQNYPEIFICLAMLVGLYGLIYFLVATDLERGWPLAAVGMLGKLLGPIGLVVLIYTGRWPMRTAVLCITNDLIWWVPFAVYLMDARKTPDGDARCTV